MEAPGFLAQEPFHQAHRPFKDGKRSASIGHLGKIACTLNAKFKWDPEKEVITDNPALNGLITRRYRGNWSLETKA